MTDQKHDDSASVHTWTELLSRVRFGTQKALGKTVSGARVHAVADRLARYATYKTGGDVRPGLARVSVDLEMDYRTVKSAVAVLVRFGLLRLVVPASRPGDADEYRLAIPVDLLERNGIEVWSPARYQLEMRKVREKVRGKYTPVNLRGPDGPQESEEEPEPAGVSRAADEVSAGAGRAADTHQAETPAGAGRAADTEPAGATEADLRPVRPLPPPTDRVDNYDLPTDEEVRTAVTGPRATAPGDPSDANEGEEQTPPAPHGCPVHGPAFAAGTRDDGKPACPLCRATAAPRPVLDPRRELASVIPIRRSAS